MLLSRHKSQLERKTQRAPVIAIKGVPILLALGENECEEDNEFIRWVHRARHLSSMIALWSSASAADVRLERKLRYEYAKLKAKGKVQTTPTRHAPIEQHVSASATAISTSLGQGADVSGSYRTIIGGKHQRS